MSGVGFVHGSTLRFSRYPLIKHHADATDVVDQIRMRDASEYGEIELIREQQVSRGTRKRGQVWGTEPTGQPLTFVVNWQRCEAEPKGLRMDS